MTPTATRYRLNDSAHRRWLQEQADNLFLFFSPAAINPAGGFFALDATGNPLTNTPRSTGVERELFNTCRMVHCYAAGHLLGRPDAWAMLDHGMQYLLQHHHDPVQGGFFWGVDDAGPVRPEKLAYGHAFVLLAAASAHEAGHPDAPRLHQLIDAIITDRFWDDDAGAMREEFNADWTHLSDYRGQNANMHSVEALMAAYEAWGDDKFLHMATLIADLIINRHARRASWVVVEHFNSDWTIDRDYAGDPMFRPAGTTPGHALEWARLLIQLWHLTQKTHDWMTEAASALFDTAVNTGWTEPRGGFVYTLDWDSKPAIANRLWWPACEGVAAAAVLDATLEGDTFAQWYGRIWQVLEADFIDDVNGAWWPEIDENGQPDTSVFVGKPDIYHALQACLIPLYPPQSGLLPAIRTQRKLA